MKILILNELDPRRHDVEKLISTTFACRYGASVKDFPFHLLTVLDDKDSAQCAVGLRNASTGFFSECYLDLPLEKALSLATHASVERSSIMELTSLAADRPGCLPALFEGIATVGLRDGYNWCIFTATSKLRSLVRRMGLPLVDLGPADPSRVEHREDWGTYYDTDPHLSAINRADAEAWFHKPRHSSAKISFAS